MIDGYVNIRFDENDHGFGFCLQDITAVLLQHGFSYDRKKILSRDIACLLRDTVEVYISFHGKEQYVDTLACYIDHEFIATTMPNYYVGTPINYLFYEVDPLLFTKAVCEPPDKIIKVFQEQKIDSILNKLD